MDCFIEGEKVHINQNAGKFMISENFDQEGFSRSSWSVTFKSLHGFLTLRRPEKCSLLTASSIDEYFSSVIDFVNWLYSDCGYSTTG